LKWTRHCQEASHSIFREQKQASFIIMTVTDAASQARLERGVPDQNLPYGKECRIRNIRSGLTLSRRVDRDKNGQCCTKSGPASTAQPSERSNEQQQPEPQMQQHLATCRIISYLSEAVKEIPQVSFPLWISIATAAILATQLTTMTTTT
jgi:hypothetical protein